MTREQGKSSALLTLIRRWRGKLPHQTAPGSIAALGERFIRDAYVAGRVAAANEMVRVNRKEGS